MVTESARKQGLALGLKKLLRLLEVGEETARLQVSVRRGGGVI